MPRVKQGHIGHRKEFRSFPINPMLASIIDWWLQIVKSDFDMLPNKKVNFSDLPLFPNWNRDYLDIEFLYHPTSSEISGLYTKIESIIKVITDRTGKFIHLTPYRSRKTLGTRAAIEGKNENLVALLLDHSSTDSVKHYIAFAREISEEIDKAIGKDIAPLISAFKGEVISKVPIAGTKQRRIRSDNPKNPDVGLCVEPSGCGIYTNDGNLLTILARVPFSCYTCPFFNAWDDIEIHRQHLQLVIKEQDNLLRGYKDNGHPESHHMSHSLDSTAKAIQEVIFLIEKNEIKQDVIIDNEDDNVSKYS